MLAITMTTFDPLAGEGSLDERRWQAVVRRDPAADGTFCYAVATTSVYCRPSCPSRLARRENISFHSGPADAERAGFRPCKRCRPEAAGPREQRLSLVAAACRRIEAAIEDGEEQPSLATLAAAAGLSRFHFHRLFKAAVGVTTKQYAASCRAGRMRSELNDSATVTEAIYAAGYGSPSRFYENAGAMLGMTPRAYRQGGRDAEIRFALAACSLGSVLVAATDRGVCAIQFGDDSQGMIEDLRRRFARARLIDGDAALADRLAAIVAHVEAPGGRLDLPLDVRGTAFQHRVWRALQAIPPGETASYSEIAARIGAPKAVRAVAAACAANPVALAIPCHRAVRADGSLAGYRWGVERKRQLLAREAGTEDGEDVKDRGP